jgi:hypothetical protein
VWAGYFTSRSALKGYIRETSGYHQTGRQVQLLAGGAADLSPANPLFNLEHAMAVAQHHDAVSGTSKQHVAYDYAKRLAGGRLEVDAMLSSAFQNLTGDLTVQFVTCDLNNATICPALESGAASIVIVYNNQAQQRPSALLRFSVATPKEGQTYAVYDYTGTAVGAQLLPGSAEDMQLRTEYYSYNNNPVCWLAFVADLPPAGYTAYFIVPSASVDAPLTAPSSVQTMRFGKKFRGAADQTLTNGIISVVFSGATGLVSSFTKNGTSAPLGQTFGWYNASAGVQNSTLAQDGQESGAYIFRYVRSPPYLFVDSCECNTHTHAHGFWCCRPNSSEVYPLAGAVTVEFVTGPIVNETRQVFNSWLSQVLSRSLAVRS